MFGVDWAHLPKNFITRETQAESTFRRTVYIRKLIAQTLECSTGRRSFNCLAWKRKKRDYKDKLKRKIFMPITIIGYLAAFCTTLAFVPQAWKIIKTKHTKDISLIMYIVFSLGVALWLFYGILLVNWPMILANAVTLILAMVILGYKIRYK